MTKKQKGTSKDHVKNIQFMDRNLSSIEAHPRDGKRLRSPFSVFENMRFARSWTDNCIPNILWACILATCMKREEYLHLFRLVVSGTRQNLSTAENLHVTHNFLATATEQEFDTMFKDVLSDETAIHHLSALLLVKSLPDSHHWRRRIKDGDRSKGFTTLSHAIGQAFDHQSQVATDVRWLKVMSHIIIRQKVFFSSQFEEQVDELRLYPNQGNMKKVRPSIRAMEVGLRENEFPTDIDGNPRTDLARPLPVLHTEEFWKEMRAETQCIPYHSGESSKTGSREVVDEISDIVRNLDAHFYATETTTAADPRHDGTFGIVGYALNLLFHAATSYIHCRLEGRIILRTIVETFITFCYLAKKDDATIWLQYRTAGAGQVKLAFLKTIREKDAPEFIDLPLMEALANEDRWMEFQDIPLGHWANLNLRRLAEEAGVKDVYDRYYDWSSSYTHGQWGAVRDAALTTCVNPLHRFHRIPGNTKGNMPSIIPDGCKLVNRMLDELNKLYPAFKPRIKWHKTNRMPTAAEVMETYVAPKPKGS